MRQEVQRIRRRMRIAMMIGSREAKARNSITELFQVLVYFWRPEALLLAKKLDRQRLRYDTIAFSRN